MSTTVFFESVKPTYYINILSIIDIALSYTHYHNNMNYIHYHITIGYTQYHITIDDTNYYYYFLFSS